MSRLSAFPAARARARQRSRASKYRACQPKRRLCRACQRFPRPERARGKGPGPLSTAPASPNDACVAPASVSRGPSARAARVQGPSVPRLPAETTPGSSGVAVFPPSGFQGSISACESREKPPKVEFCLQGVLEIWADLENRESNDSNTPSIFLLNTLCAQRALTDLYRLNPCMLIKPIYQSVYLHIYIYIYMGFHLLRFPYF